MTEDIKPEVLKRTQTALKKYIKKPPLTDKYLKKPPFRFLHDIITSVIKETGFLKDIFTTEELIADNVKDKDSKIKFLTKLLTALKDTTGSALKAKPGKIVAGLEVDKTHELLQAIAKGIGIHVNGNKTQSNGNGQNKKIKTPESVETKSKSKVTKEKLENQVSENAVENSKKKETDHENDHSKEKKEKSEKKVMPEKEGKETTKELKKKESFPSEENNIPQESEVKKQEKENSKNDTNKSAEEPKFSEEIITTGEKYLQQLSVDDGKSQDISATNKENDIILRHKEVPEKTTESSEPQKESIIENQTKRPSTRRSSSRSVRQPMKAIDDKSDEEKGKDDNKINLESSADVKKNKENKNIIDKKDINVEAEIISPPSVLERPRTARRAPPRPLSARPRSGRPPSVRPGAPKTRDRGEVVDTKIEKENESKEVVVITENDKVEEDNEEMVIVEQKSVTLEKETNIEDIPSSAAGILVDILESEIHPDDKKQIDIDWQSGKRDKKEVWKKECDQLRDGIQKLTRSTGPLGKLFDFLQEDVDLAARELTYWRESSVNYFSKLTTENRITDETLSKHRKKLMELEALIEEEKEAIRSVKSSILLNDKKIMSFLSRVPDV